MAGRRPRPPAAFQVPPNSVLRVKIGDEVCEGTGISVQAYRDYGGREIFQLELTDPILIEGDN